MGVFEFLVPFYPINTAWVFSSSDLKMDPLNLYPTICDPIDFTALTNKLRNIIYLDTGITFLCDIAVWAR